MVVVVMVRDILVMVGGVFNKVLWVGGPFEVSRSRMQYQNPLVAGWMEIKGFGKSVWRDIS